MTDVARLANPNEVKFLMDRDQVAKAAQQCNMKKRELSFLTCRSQKISLIVS